LASIIIKMNIQNAHEIKIILITIKLIFHHQVRQERVTFFSSSRNEGNKWEMRAKIMSMCLTLFFFLQKKKHMRVRDKYNFEKKLKR